MEDDGLYNECVPPSVVFCLPRSGDEAAVWWLIRADDETQPPSPGPRSRVDVEQTPLSALAGVTGWQVLRYRRDRSPPFEWRLKGAPHCLYPVSLTRRMPIH